MSHKGFRGEMDAGQIKIERERARELRKSDWWDRRLADGVCYYCQGSVDRQAATMDHIVPLSRGGKSNKGNVVVCCKACNSKKQDMTAVEWLLYLESIRHELG